MNGDNAAFKGRRQIDLGAPQKSGDVLTFLSERIFMFLEKLLRVTNIGQSIGGIVLDITPVMDK